MMHIMPIDRRQFLLGSTAAIAAPLSAYGLDAAQFGVRAGASDDQSRAFQRHSTRRPARARRSSLRQVSTAPVISTCRPARSLLACVAQHA
jgi:hypothetical protein